MTVLDFEQPIVDLEEKINELRSLDENRPGLAAEIQRLEAKSRELGRVSFERLSAWEIVRLSRHPDRPYTRDYIDGLFGGFIEVHGDRCFGDDPAIISGLARFGGTSVVVIGHQKGRSTKENMHRTFGMPRPEGYRKAKRLMELARRFRRPLITFIDTPGAYPGIGAEERGQAEAIAQNLEVMAGLDIPTISVVIGEGGSGGALALGVTNRILMLQHSTYSVISPEGCASILWKDRTRAADAARVLKLCAADVHRLGIVDEVVEEPPGGGHRDPAAIIRSVGMALGSHLRELQSLSPEELLEQRYEKFRTIGVFQES